MLWNPPTPFALPPFRPPLRPISLISSVGRLAKLPGFGCLGGITVVARRLQILPTAGGIEGERSGKTCLKLLVPLRSRNLLVVLRVQRDIMREFIIVGSAGLLVFASKVEVSHKDNVKEQKKRGDESLGIYLLDSVVIYQHKASFSDVPLVAEIGSLCHQRDVIP
jgi:hypothetical protein